MVKVDAGLLDESLIQPPALDLSKKKKKKKPKKIFLPTTSSQQNKSKNSQEKIFKFVVWSQLYTVAPATHG